MRTVPWQTFRAYSAGRKHNWQSETMLDIGTGKNYTEDHDLFREQARKFWKNIDSKRVAEWDKNHVSDPEIWREAGKAGLLCLGNRLIQNVKFDSVIFREKNFIRA